MKKAKILEDRAIWGPMSALEAKAEEDVRDLILELTGKSNREGSTEQKIADFYTSSVDTKTINELGMKPFEKDLAELAGLKTHAQVVALATRLGFPGNCPIFVAPELDDKNPDRYVALVVQAGLGLPVRDFYLSQDPRFIAIRTKVSRLHRADAHARASSKRC